ncbi:MAG: hypothetical protein EBR40_11445, partial [Proteobacteria bacterium]|nr:hypothetical protein [Pseudomonadota bacterium]
MGRFFSELLGLIREKLAVTQGSTIALNVLVMNLEKLLELLFVFFAYWLQLLLGNEGGKGSRFAHLSHQLAPVSTTRPFELRSLTDSARAHFLR